MAREGLKTWQIFLLSAAYSMCWALPNHAPPWMSFHADALASLVLLIGALVVFVRTKGVVYIDGISATVASCVFVIAAQYQFGLIDSFGVAWINALYVFGLFLALIIGRVWSRVDSFGALDFVFLSFFIGATISFLFQVHQVFDLAIFSDFILQGDSGRYSGNIGQPNQAASLFMLGILSCAWLCVRRYIKRNSAFFMAALFVVALVLAGSRTTIVNMVVIILLLFCYRKVKGVSELMFASFFLTGLYFLCLLFIPYLLVFFNAENGLTEIRPMVDSARISIWKGLFYAVLERPLFGYGWGQISHAQVSDALPALDIGGLVVQSHNLFLDIFLWNGLLFGSLVVFVFIYWFFHVLSRISDLNQILALLVLMVLLVHSMLEFPLHYAYFLFPAGVVLGALNQLVNIRAVRLSAGIGLLVLFISATSFFLTIRDYIIVENGFYDLRMVHNNISNVDSFDGERVIVLTHLRDYIVFARMPLERSHYVDGVQLGMLAISGFPSTLAMYKLSVLLAYLGRDAESQYWRERVCKLFNSSQCNYVNDEWERDFSQMKRGAAISRPVSNE